MLKKIKNYKWILLASMMLLAGGLIAGCGETKKDPTDNGGGGTPSVTGSGVPVGAVMYFATTKAPEGWKICDGSGISTKEYEALFKVIGTIYGGDGVSSFNLPDLRGEFIRGWDNGRGVDKGRQFGSPQADEFKSHNHQHTYSYYAGNGLYHPNSPNSVAAGNDNATLGRAAIGMEGSSETRPRNIALLPCIKY